MVKIDARSRNKTCPSPRHEAALDKQFKIVFVLEKHLRDPGKGKAIKQLDHSLEAASRNKRRSESGDIWHEGNPRQAGFYGSKYIVFYGESENYIRLVLRKGLSHPKD